jgi:hypothetical protein
VASGESKLGDELLTIMSMSWACKGAWSMTVGRQGPAEKEMERDDALSVFGELWVEPELSVGAEDARH